MICAAESKLAADHLEARGHVPDSVATSLAHAGRHRRWRDGAGGGCAGHLVLHAQPWAIFDGAPRDRRVEAALIRLAIEEGAMAPVWMRAGA